MEPKEHKRDCPCACCQDEVENDFSSIFEDVSYDGPDDHFLDCGTKD